LLVYALDVSVSHTRTKKKNLKILGIGHRSAEEDKWIQE